MTIVASVKVRDGFVTPLYEAVFQGVNEDARPLLGLLP
jgi:hypothetical protein